MTNLLHKGWCLETEEELDSDNFWYHEHYAVRDNKKVHLKGSRFERSFWPTLERFCYLVDHDFPSAPRGGNWFNDELDKLIAQENDGDKEKIRQSPGAGEMVEGAREEPAVVRSGEHSSEPDEGRH